MIPTHCCLLLSSPVSSMGRLNIPYVGDARIEWRNCSNHCHAIFLRVFKSSYPPLRNRAFSFKRSLNIWLTPDISTWIMLSMMYLSDPLFTIILQQNLILFVFHLNSHVLISRFYVREKSKIVALALSLQAFVSSFVIYHIFFGINTTEKRMASTNRNTFDVKVSKNKTYNPNLGTGNNLIMPIYPFTNIFIRVRVWDRLG